MLVDSCLHCLLFKNEKDFIYVFIFKAHCDCFSYFHDKTSLQVGSSVSLLNANSCSEHHYWFNPFSGHNRSFKMLIDYTLDLPLPSSAPLKEKTKMEIQLF